MKRIAQIVYCALASGIAGVCGYATQGDSGASTPVENAITARYVSPIGLHIFPFTNWVEAATNIQSAVDAAVAGDIVWVTNGVYSVSIPVAVTNAIFLCSLNGRGSVLLDGQGITQVLRVSHPDAIVRGFTVANGMSSGSAGGIHCLSGRVEDCVVRHCEAPQAGGVQLDWGSVLSGSLIVSNRATASGAGGVLAFGGRIEASVIADNRAEQGGAGGGVTLIAGVLLDSTVTGNVAGTGGGVLCVQTGRVERCAVYGNAATNGLAGGVALALASVLADSTVLENVAEQGGGVAVWGGDVVSSIIAGNHATLGGGVILGPVEPSEATIQGTNRLLNCTVVGNVGTISGGGVISVTNAVIQNTIIWDNAAPTWPQVSTGGPGNVFMYNCSDPLLPGPGNMAAAPELTPFYRLMRTSPCIDAGIDSDAPPLDIDGEARWDHPHISNVVSIVDIGADEFVDTDLDGMADVWEIEYFGGLAYSDGTGDEDADDLDDLAEYEHGTDPNNPDTDDDGMPDGWEVQHGFDPLRTTDAAMDADGDGMSNLAEYLADTDPHDADSVLAFIHLDRQFGGIRLDWKGGRDAWQILEVRENLAYTTELWTAILALPPPTALTNAVIDMGATNRNLFYRIRATR